MLYQWATDSAQINEFTIYMPVSSFLKTHYGTTFFYDQYFSNNYNNNICAGCPQYFYTIGWVTGRASDL